jgi:hypothetical protein
MTQICSFYLQLLQLFSPGKFAQAVNNTMSSAVHTNLRFPTVRTADPPSRLERAGHYH